MSVRPIVHITDLYHPPQDPDDHFDLATLMALPELDLKAVLLDATAVFLEGVPGEDHPREPGLIPVLQLSHLTGRPIPVAVGPTRPLRALEDDASDLAPSQQGAIRLFLETLEAASQPVLVSIVGSVRIFSAAFNRNPDLVLRKTARVLLNAGAHGPRDDEWNVMLDTHAWNRLWQSGVPVDWYPCTGVKGPFAWDAHNTFWRASHADILPHLPPQLRAWFHYAFSGSHRSDLFRSLAELGGGTTWNTILSEPRNFWSTASIVQAAERVLASTEEGWRFIPADNIDSTTEVRRWSLDPVEVRPVSEKTVVWEPAASHSPSRHRIYNRGHCPPHDAAMAEALAALLATLVRE